MIEVKKHKDSTITNLNWDKTVTKYTNQENFKEAFSNADAIIDNTVEFLLREVYKNEKCHDLINEMHYLRGRINFDGMILLEILKSKTIVNEKLLQRVRDFKKIRNIVLHKLTGVYDLLSFEEFEKTSNENYKIKATEKAKKWLEEARKINIELHKKLYEITEKGTAYYFSDKFYTNHPRIKQMDKNKPKSPKK